MRRGVRRKELRGAGARVGLATAVITLSCLIPSTAAEAAGGGKVRFIRNATSAFDSVIEHPSAHERRWMASHYWRMRGYAPFFNRALDWAPPTHLYKDLYAIYRDRPADRQLMNRHPTWVLRDTLGRPLYIQWNCNGSSCTQYAADIGNPQWRRHWINQARDMMGKGYDGIFVDDVNLLMRVSNGAGTFVRPFDPRTLAPMTDANWRRYVAEFTEEIRAAFTRKEIVHNGIWWIDHADPYHQRQVRAADILELERGFNDPARVGGAGSHGYETFLAHVDWLHSRGAAAMYEPYNLTATSREFELASYFLVKSGRDALVSDHHANPGDWWPGWETNLRAPEGQRYGWNGLLRRDFAAGMVLVNQPGAAARTVDLPSGPAWVDLRGVPVTSVTLGSRRAAVLRKPAQMTIRLSPARAVRSGDRIRIRGSSMCSAVAIRRKRAGTGAWRTVAPGVGGRRGRFRATVIARARGRHHYRATAEGCPSSPVARIRVSR